MKKYDKKAYIKEAVVSYIISDDKVLLIEKKRGLGAGKINVPGGHIEYGETPYNAAVRETHEEVNLVTNNLTFKGYLFFRFTDGLTMKGWVYITENFEGTPQESDEAKPFWNDLNSIPYDRMWADDIVWIPEMLKGRFFRGYFEFDGDNMIRREVEFYDSLEDFNP